ncbi:extracellular serine/threonine protein [Vespula maculifrons]|uniref:Extracellular serine/threonine protein n=1 Tax=Vespula maculifrons TaxID=7453 RepID=A0ABD2BUI3_VESMC
MKLSEGKDNFPDSFCPQEPSLFYGIFRKNATTLEKFHLQISRIELYPKDSSYVDELLRQMATQPITHVGKFSELSFSFLFILRSLYHTIRKLF